MEVLWRSRFCALQTPVEQRNGAQPVSQCNRHSSTSATDLENSNVPSDADIHTATPFTDVYTDRDIHTETETDGVSRPAYQLAFWRGRRGGKGKEGWPGLGYVPRRCRKTGSLSPPNVLQCARRSSPGLDVETVKTPPPE